MAPLRRNKVALDAAADSESRKSLSFAGLLSIQDQQPGNQDCQMNKKTTKKKQLDEEFEFSTVGEPAGGGRNPSNVPVSISAGTATQKPAAVDIVLICSDKKPPPQKSNTNERKVGEKNKKKRSSGRSVFRSFLSPCQDCRTQNSVVQVAVR
ncbi:unnamed protein product [Linum trigynum]|uniref:Uncharacterized protein n=1 Tax=Linum trigynum TaxID=586398 RepID=A0AAV2FJ85_9ROSI